MNFFTFQYRHPQHGVRAMTFLGYQYDIQDMVEAALLVKDMTEYVQIEIHKYKVLSFSEYNLPQTRNDLGNIDRFNFEDFKESDFEAVPEDLRRQFFEYYEIKGCYCASKNILL